MPDNTPQQHDRAVVRVNNSLLQIDSEIQAVPDDTIGYNEYAWLVANTQGDIAKATRYSKLSLIKSFDSAATSIRSRTAGLPPVTMLLRSGFKGLQSGTNRIIARSTTILNSSKKKP